MEIPSGKHTNKLWTITMFNGKSTMFMACSIAMLNCQRVITWDNDNIWQLYKDKFVGYNPTVIPSLVYIYS